MPNTTLDLQTQLHQDEIITHMRFLKDISNFHALTQFATSFEQIQHDAEDMSKFAFTNMNRGSMGTRSPRGSELIDILKFAQAGAFLHSFHIGSDPEAVTQTRIAFLTFFLTFLINYDKIELNWEKLNEAFLHKVKQIESLSEPLEKRITQGGRVLLSDYLEWGEDYLRQLADRTKTIRKQLNDDERGDVKITILDSGIK